jgi:hypothetical protein
MVARQLLEESNDLAGAERELRAALAEKALLARLRPSFALRAQAYLALVLEARQQAREARAAAAPVCAASDAAVARVRVQLALRGLCEESASAPAH